MTDASSRLVKAALDGRKTEKVTLTVEGTPEALTKLMNLLAAIQYNTGVGHSCTIGAFFDGDGADKIHVDGIPEANAKLGKDMASACSEYGDGLLAQIDTSTAHTLNARYVEYSGDTVEIVQRRKVYPEAD